MNNTMIIRCPHCAEKMSVPSDYAGLESTCPKCRRAFVMGAEPAPSAPAPRTPVAQPPPVPSPATIRARRLRRAGWTCFSIGMAALLLCPIYPFYWPFFLAAFVLSVILLAKEEGQGGLALLLTTLLAPITLGAVIFVLGIGTMLAVLSGCVKEVENTNKSLVKQQAVIPSQWPRQQAPVLRPPAQQPKPPARKFVFQPPVAQVQKPPATAPLPTREIAYDSLLLVLNRYGIESKAATTTAQKQDVRARAERAAGDFVDNARVTLAGTVTDIQFGTDGTAALSVGSFRSPEYDRQGQKTLLFTHTTEKLNVPMTRAEALAVKSGQKVWITGRLQVSPATMMTAGLGGIASPSLLFIQFRDDFNMMLTLRVMDYTVSFEEKRSQASIPGKKKDYLIVVPPKASP